MKIILSSIALLLMLACQSTPTRLVQTNWQPIVNLESEPSALESFTDGDGNILKRLVEAPMEKAEGERRIRSRMQGLILLSQRLIDPYYGTSRSQAGCLRESDLNAPSTQNSSEIVKKVSSVSNKDFVLVDCADSEIYYQVQMVYAYCIADKSYREFRVYIKRNALTVPTLDHCNTESRP
jgi:hypothetical protein